MSAQRYIKIKYIHYYCSAERCLSMSTLRKPKLPFCFSNILSEFNRYLNTHFLTVICLFFQICDLQSQEIPPFKNFSPSLYNAGHQNWSLAQDRQRLIYAGNTEGLLVFNGSEWNLIKSQNINTVRSVVYWKGKIYVGGYGEIAVLDQVRPGKFQLTSLTPLIKDVPIATEEIWNIAKRGNKLYFQSFSIILEFNGESFRNITPPGNIMFIHNVNDRLFVQVIDSGIYEILGDGSFVLLSGTEKMKNFQVTGILPSNENKILITTAKNGIYSYSNDSITVWNPSLQKIFSEYQINKFIRLNEEKFALGTIRGGLLILDKNGDILFNFNKRKGLYNNTVLSLLQDIDGNVWTGLDKGISMVEVKSPLLIYPDAEGQLGTVYSAVQDGLGRLLLGTNQGIYYSDTRSDQPEQYETSMFKLLSGSQGHVWQLKKTDAGILAGHNDGTFLIKNTELRKVSDINGGYCTTTIPENSALLLQGTYTGLIILQYDHEWKFRNRVSGFTRPVKMILSDIDGYYWITSPVSGIFKIKTDAEYSRISFIRKYDNTRGLESDINPDIFKFKDQIYIRQKDGYFKYDRATDMFLADQTFRFEAESYLLRNGYKDDYFKVYRDSTDLYRNDSFIKKFDIRLQKDYYNVCSLNEKKYLLCLEEGYAIISDTVDQAGSEQQYIPLILDYIKLKNSDQFLEADLKEGLWLSNEENNFSVHFYQAVYHTPVQFRTMLKGHDRSWNEWSIIPKAEYNNIPHGKYTLLIESGYDGQLIILPVVIRPPRYLSKIAYLLYSVMILILLRSIVVYINLRVKRTEEKLKAENERILREHKTEMDNQRLLAENIAKSKELANSTIHLVKKNELLLEIKNELSNARKHPGQVIPAKDYQKLMHLISENITSDEDWNLFESSFNEVHERFMKKLKEAYPDLSLADLKLAAYLKMDLSSKEIAPLFNISVRGLENKRYRLRKKIGLSNEANLNEFFMNFD